MKLKIKIFCVFLATFLVLINLVGCAKPLWSENYVDITYDDSGFPIINFSDNLSYTTYEGEIGFGVCHMYSPSEFSKDLDAVISLNAFESMYLIKVLKRCTQEEAKNLDVYLDKYPYNIGTYFEVALIYDYVNNKEINEIIYYMSPKSINNQIEGKPLFSVGDCWIGILFEDLQVENLYGFSSLGCFVKDQKNISQDTFVYAWRYDDELECIELELTDEEKIIQGEFEDNPLIIVQKFRLGDVVNFLKNALEERGYEIQY
ncbi:MAG: hypothetical protein PHI78_03675 [Clostridia bacterium]|nr:hypothetical protein [Clostridia bacterium]